MITYLAIVFLVLILVIAYFGIKFLIHQKSISIDEINNEKCSLCRNNLYKHKLIVRDVFVVKVFFFCKNCIVNLHNELTQKKIDN